MLKQVFYEHGNKGGTDTMTGNIRNQKAVSVPSEGKYIMIVTTHFYQGPVINGNTQPVGLTHNRVNSFLHFTGHFQFHHHQMILLVQLINLVLNRLGLVYAIFLFLGYASVPISVLLKLVTLPGEV